MLGFGKKKASAPPPPPAGGMGVPTQKVMSLSSQGMSEPEIIRNLREEGHTPLEVDRAMKDAMRTGAGTQRSPAAPQPGPAAHPVTPQQPAPAAAPPPRAAPQFPVPQFGARDKFAPTDWGNEDDDMTDDDFDMDKADRFPAEKKMGPGALMGGMDEKLPPMPPAGPRDSEPLPFARAPLPKEKDDKIRELKDRRRKEIEELTEEITEEKWKDMMNRVQMLEENLDKLSGDIKNATAQTHGGSPDEIGPVKEELAKQKESVEEVNARIDSLEEVVKSSLGPMLDSVRKFNKMSKAPHTQHLHETPSATPEHKEPGESEASEPSRYSPDARNK